MKSKYLWTAAVLVIAAFLFWPRIANTQQPQKSSPLVGRYQIVINPNYTPNTFLLDTETGKTWVQTPVTGMTETATIWVYRDRVDDFDQQVKWDSAH